jgi:hypothetical protein
MNSQTEDGSPPDSGWELCVRTGLLLIHSPESEAGDTLCRASGADSLRCSSAGLG